MRHRVIFLFCIFSFLSSSLQAQNQPVVFSPNMLAKSQGLPDDFLLFLPDTNVQILFNPARAASSGQKFFYANRLPYSGTTFSIATLFNAIGASWLLQVSSRINRNVLDQTSHSASSSQSIYPNETRTYLENKSLSSSSSSTYSFNFLKLSKTGKIGRNYYSLGAFAIFYPDEMTLNNNSMSNDQTISTLLATTPPLIRESNETSRPSDRMQRMNSKYAAGLEFSLAGADWDLITGVQLQKNRMQISFNHDNVITREDKTYNDSTDIYTYESNQHEMTSIKTTEPFIYKAYVYFHQAADLITASDHYFISSSIYSSSGIIYRDRTVNINYWSQSNNDPVYRDTLASEKNLRKEETNDWGISLSTGYVITKNLADIDFLAGFNPRFDYEEYKEVQAGDNSIKHQVWTTGIQIPIYLNFTPAEWCSFFGGFNYWASYIYKKSNSSFLPPINVPSSPNPDSEQLESVESTLTSSNKIYAGLELRHHLGIRLQITFNNNLSEYTGWNISLGYVY